jgi:hypothetical protein
MMPEINMIHMKEHDHEQCVHIFKIKLKSLIKSCRTKQSCKSSYTIFEGLPNEKHGEHAKIKIKNILV